jgi:integrase
VTRETTKSGEPFVVRLSKIVADAIEAYDWRAGPGLFGHYTFNNKRNLQRDIARAGKRAGVPPKPPHTIGRHAFATRLAKSGKSLMEIKEAGGWKSPRMVFRYAHLVKSELHEQVAKMGDDWGRSLEGGEVVSLKVASAAKPRRR